MTERASLMAEGSCCHGSDGRTSVTIVASGRTVRVCTACDVHEQIAAATNIPSELQRLEQGRNGTLLLYTNLAGGFGADDNKAYIAPIVFTCLLVAAAVVGVTLVILWELKDLRCLQDCAFSIQLC